MKKKLFLSIFMLLSSGVNASEMARIRAKHLLAPSELGSVSLRHDGMNFHVVQNGKRHAVANYDVDSVLRQVNKANLPAYLKAAKIGVHKLSDGSFALRSHVLGKGGGVLGAAAGCWLGKFLVHATAQTVIWGTGAVVSVFATPVAGGIVVSALQATLIVPTEVASNYAAIAGGIALGTATGPV